MEAAQAPTGAAVGGFDALSPIAKGFAEFFLYLASCPGKDPLPRAVKKVAGDWLAATHNRELQIEKREVTKKTTGPRTSGWIIFKSATNEEYAAQGRAAGLEKKALRDFITKQQSAAWAALGDEGKAHYKQQAEAKNQQSAADAAAKAAAAPGIAGAAVTMAPGVMAQPAMAVQQPVGMVTQYGVPGPVIRQ
jgi:hypothetical protein